MKRKINTKNKQQKLLGQKLLIQYIQYTKGHKFQNQSPLFVNFI